MANSASMTVYRGSRNMRSYEGSKADEKRDSRSGRSERSAVERKADKAEARAGRKSATSRQAGQTIVGKSRTPRVRRVMSQASFGGDDIGS